MQLQSRLSERSKSVKTGHVQSACLPITKGVLQGSTLFHSLSISTILYHPWLIDRIILMRVTLLSTFFADFVQQATKNVQLSFKSLEDSLISSWCLMPISLISCYSLEIENLIMSVSVSTL